VISKNGTGDTSGQALYTSALAAGAYLPCVHLTAASNGATIVDLYLGGVRLQRDGSGNAPIPSPVFLKPTDALTYDVSNSSGGTWAFDFTLYPLGDVAV